MGIRVDSGVYGGWRVPSNYDSLIAKVIAHAPNRDEALRRMSRALDEFIVAGIRTNIPLHKRLLRDPEVVSGTMSTRTIERVIADGLLEK
jgi:acetyl-CoA carboxylase biotin carboxylase subunit